MASLAERKIPFDLRLRENQYVQRQGHAEMTVQAIAQNLKAGQTLIVKHPCRLGREAKAPAIRLVILRLQTGELLALATSRKPRHALARYRARYRARWRIECLFANLKTKGFNCEVEPLRRHLTQPAKRATLMAILAIAVALAAKAGAVAHRRKPIKIKAHGRKAVSNFAHGLAVLRKAIANSHTSETAQFLRAALAPNETPRTIKQCLG